MIDPTNITNYNLSYIELEKYLLWWILAAGKNGTIAARNLEKLLKEINCVNESPLLVIQDFVSYYGLNYLANLMKNNGIGCYNSKARSFYELSISELDLRTCSAEDLEKIYGIGMKTARCFIIHSRKDARYAGLDTHMLKHLRSLGVPKVPGSTPSSKKIYNYLEKIVLELADEQNMSPADYDLMVWNSYAIIPVDNQT